ncbi:hypothetical protein BCR35DRAFT_306050 [Leucosporidium creatinivorum]|uniref:Uncharacterized protein n=1 Tax=Leucosporidium creatinivorum TaxID=106004 RepID=A0A1Y2EZ22_9BASI|nr:hypothetical protein BCR35DRAFT_306050 [Leucosporidium creatinivorum]
MDSMAPHASQVYSQPFWRPITGAMQLLSLMLITSMFTHRLPPWKMEAWRALTLPRWAILALLADSLLFVFAGALYTLGIGTSLNGATCSSAIWFCIVLYASCKVLITFFLVERVHIVHGQEEPRRHKNKIYLFNCILIAAWAGIFAWLVAQQKTEIRPSDGECRFFIAPGASAAGGILDVVIISYLSLLFAIPLYRGRWVNAEIRRLAVKSLCAAVISMASSTTNLMIIAFTGHGFQLSWLCFVICTTDCLINATVLFLITSSDSSTSSNPSRPLTDPSLAHPSQQTSSRRRSVGPISMTVEAFTISELLEDDEPERRSRRRRAPTLGGVVEEDIKEKGLLEDDGADEDDPASWRGDAQRLSPTLSVVELEQGAGAEMV